MRLELGFQTWIILNLQIVHIDNLKLNSFYIEKFKMCSAWKSTI